MMQISVFLTAVLAISSLGVQADARKLLVVCSVGEGLCAAACDLDGYKYSSYNCNSDRCSCTNNPLRACFPGSAVVTTPAGPKSMDKVALGDEVLTVNNDGQLVFNKVYMFSSYRPQARASFVHMTTSAGSNITLTASHFMFAQKAAAGAALSPKLAAWKYLTPSELEVGDYVMVAKSYSHKATTARITSLRSDVPGVGLYNPHTKTGAIVVNNVVASEQTAFLPKWLAGRRFHTGLAYGLKMAFNILPRGMDAPLSALAARIGGHGVSDLFVSREAFFGGMSKM